jgi:hypothetical protein
MTDCKAIAGGYTTGLGIWSGVTMVAGFFAGNPAVGLAIMTSGMQTASTAVSTANNMGSEVERQKDMCAQLDLLDAETGDLHNLIHVVKKATEITQDVLDKIKDKTIQFKNRKEKLKDMQNKYMVNLSIYSIICIFVLVYLAYIATTKKQARNNFFSSLK